MAAYNLLDDEKEVAEKLDDAIDDFVERFREIQEQHPEAGLGDTHTDEAIVQKRGYPQPREWGVNSYFIPQVLLFS